MRYVRYKKVLTKVFDDVLDNNDDIYNVLNTIKKQEISCKIRFISGLLHNLVRVLKIDKEKNECLLCVVTEHASLRKNVTISEIDYLEVVTDTELFVSSKSDKMSRFSMLNPSELNSSDTEQ